MSSLLSPDTFEFFASYLLAGYVVILVRSRFVAGLRPRPSELVIEAVLFSLINELLALGIGTVWTLVPASPMPQSGSILERLLFLAKILVLPSLLGALLGYNLRAGWKNALLRRLSLPIVHPVQRGHDYAFGFDRPPGFVIVTYYDGTIVRGFFGESSLAATDEERSDLYLERLYSVDSNEQWIEPSPRRSGLIALKDVRSIEFLDEEESQNVEQ